jgi:hypothetical protein
MCQLANEYNHIQDIGAMCHVKASYTTTKQCDYLQTSTLTMDSLITHLIIFLVLLGCVGNFAKALHDDRLLLRAIIKQKPVDWARLVLHHMLKGATGTTPLPYPMLITTILCNFRVNLVGEYITSTDKQNFEIGESVLHRAGISFMGDNWYINDLEVLVNRPKEDFPETEEPSEPPQEPLPTHFQLLSLKISQMIEACFEQQRLYFDQRCEQMESSL